MPTFYGRSTSVQLSVANLAKATTPNPQPRQCSASTSSIKQIDLEFAKASRDGTLAENALLGDDGRHLRFLGKDEDMPFFMVRAGKDFFNPYATATTTKRPAKSVKAQTSDNTVLYDSDLDEVEKAAIPFRATSTFEANKQDRHPIEPHALCLTVFLSKASFSQPAYKDRMRINVKHDIKIDVYFNGQFFNSQIMGVGQLHTTGSRGIKVRMHRITGQRLNRFIEKPWIFVPPARQLHGSSWASSPRNVSITEDLGADANTNRRAPPLMNASILENLADTGRNQRASNPKNASLSDNLELDAGAHRRWTAIADGLLKEADKVGRDKDGERPITGEYLESLASLPAPPELQDMQKARSASFGVIDVVVVYGKGQKDAADSKYLTGPTPLRLKGYTPESNIVEANEGTQGHVKGVESLARDPNGVSPLTTFAHKLNNVSTITPAPDNGCDGQSRSTRQLILDAVATPTPTSQPNPAPKTRAEALATALTLDGSGGEHPQTVNSILNELYPPPQNHQRALPTSTTRQISASPIRRTTPKRSRETSISSETSNPSKRPRMPYYHIITAKRTVAEEMESIVEQAVEEAEMLTTRRTSTNTKAGAETVDTSPWNSAPEASLIEVPKPSKVVVLKVSPQKLVQQHGPSPPKPIDSGKTPARFTTPDGQDPNLISLFAGNTSAKSTPAPSRRRSLTTKPDLTHSFDADFVPPELSEDCCVTFAERGMVRSVGAIRGGWFEEKGVLMGTRFIVG